MRLGPCTFNSKPTSLGHGACQGDVSLNEFEVPSNSSMILNVLDGGGRNEISFLNLTSYLIDHGLLSTTDEIKNVERYQASFQCSLTDSPL